MSELKIHRDDGPVHGRYVATCDGSDARAELTYTRIKPRLLSADHTSVPDALRGKGVGLALIERLVADSRAAGSKIIPRCPYVNAEQKKHPHWRDVLQDRDV
jgi:uncharacterized protein